MNNLENAKKAIQGQHISVQNFQGSALNLTGIHANRIMIEEMKMKLMEMIRMERKNQHLTQRQLAQKAYTSQGTITRAERHGYVSLWTLITIVNGLGKKLIIQ